MLISASVRASETPFLSNMDVWKIIKDGQTQDNDHRTWVRQEVWIADGKTKVFKAQCPPEFYELFPLSGGRIVTREPESDFFVCEAEIARINGHAVSPYTDDTIRLRVRRLD